MAGRRTRSNRGINIKVDGLEELLDATRGGQKALPDVYRTVLRGEGGRAIEQTAKRLTPRGRTGALAASIKLKDLPSRGFGHAGAVEVGPWGKHPKSSSTAGQAYDNVVISTWVEGGTKPHEINPGARAGRARARRGASDRNVREGLLLPSGRWVSHVEHPGYRGKRPMGRTLRKTRPIIERELLAELDRRRWGPSERRT